MPLCYHGLIWSGVSWLLLAGTTIVLLVPNVGCKVLFLTVSGRVIQKCFPWVTSADGYDNLVCHWKHCSSRAWRPKVLVRESFASILVSGIMVHSQGAYFRWGQNRQSSLICVSSTIENSINYHNWEAEGADGLIGAWIITKSSLHHLSFPSSENSVDLAVLNRLRNIAVIHW